MRGKKVISLILTAFMVTGLALPADVRAEQQDAEAVSAVSESDEPAKLELWYDEPATNYNWIPVPARVRMIFSCLSLGTAIWERLFMGS